MYTKARETSLFWFLSFLGGKFPTESLDKVLRQLALFSSCGVFCWVKPCEDWPHNITSQTTPQQWRNPATMDRGQIRGCSVRRFSYRAVRSQMPQTCASRAIWPSTALWPTLPYWAELAFTTSPSLRFSFFFFFDCLFVGINPEKLYSASCWEASKPPGSGHTRAEAQTATCIPKTAAQITYFKGVNLWLKPLTVIVPQLGGLVFWDRTSHFLLFFHFFSNRTRFSAGWRVRQPNIMGFSWSACPFWDRISMFFWDRTSIFPFFFLTFVEIGQGFPHLWSVAIPNILVSWQISPPL